MSNKLEDYYKRSEMLAQQIEMIKAVAFTMDWEYVNEMADTFIKQGNMQDAMMVLNPAHPSEKNELLRTQGKALKKLAEFVQLLKECEEGKAKVKQAEDSRREILSLFI